MSPFFYYVPLKIRVMLLLLHRGVFTILQKNKINFLNSNFSSLGRELCEMWPKKEVKVEEIAAEIL